MQHGPQLKDVLAGKDVAFIYLCGRSPESTWKQNEWLKPNNNIIESCASIKNFKLKNKKEMIKSVQPFVISKLLLSILCIACFFTSCNKERSNNNNNEAFHVKCTVDGTPMTFNGYVFCHYEWAGGKKAVTINGATGLSATAASVGFVITNIPSGDSINAGTYTDASTNFEVLASYAPNISTIAYDAGTTVFNEAKLIGATITNHFVVKITSLNNQTARGTFSGDFYYDGDPSGAKKTITNGEFYVPVR